MPARTSEAIWEGNLQEGNGTFRLGSGAFEAPYSFRSRFYDHGPGTNPEELIAAAHAGCFSMALAHALEQAHFAPVRVATVAKVHLAKTNGDYSIPKIELQTEADVPGIDEATFQKYADDAKRNCPVSKLLASAEIVLNAHLLTNV